METIICQYKDEISRVKELLCGTISVIENHSFPKDINGSVDKSKHEYVAEYSSESVPKFDDIKVGNKCVYIIFCESDVSVETLRAEITEAKKNSNLKLPLYNESNEQKFKEMKVLYVGSSKSLNTRLNQHFTNAAAKSTYALHVSEWHENLKCKVFVFDLTEETKDSDYKLLLIEDTLSSIYKPLLGKRGPNTK